MTGALLALAYPDRIGPAAGRGTAGRLSPVGRPRARGADRGAIRWPTKNFWSWADSRRLGPRTSRIFLARTHQPPPRIEELYADRIVAEANGCTGARATARWLAAPPAGGWAHWWLEDKPGSASPDRRQAQRRDGSMGVAPTSGPRSPAVDRRTPREKWRRGRVRPSLRRLDDSWPDLSDTNPPRLAGEAGWRRSSTAYRARIIWRGSGPSAQR